MTQPPAQEPVPEIPETVVIGAPPFPGGPLDEGDVLTPTRTEAAASEVGSSVTVINEEEIDKVVNSKPGDSLHFPFDLQTFCTENDLKIAQLEDTLNEG